MRVVVIDNYDSFTFNLVHYLEQLGAEVETHRADRVRVDDIARARPDRLLISPGPGRPETAGISLDAIRAFAGQVPILGVCLGHQAIATAFGGKVVRAPRLMHGRTSTIMHGGKGVLAGLPSPFTAMRYHSLVVDRASLPEEIEVTAEASDDGTIMALRHRRLAVEGVQFHPESFLTEEGRRMLGNWIEEGVGSGAERRGERGEGAAEEGRRGGGEEGDGEQGTIEETRKGGNEEGGEGEV